MAQRAAEIAEQLRQRMVEVDWPGFAAFFADDALFEYPFGFPGAPPEIRGRTAIEAHLIESRAHVRSTISVSDIETTVHETTDPGVVIIEFRVSGTRLATGEAFSFESGVCVLTVRDGAVTRFRDYSNTIGAAHATGRALPATQGAQA